MFECTARFVVHLKLLLFCTMYFSHLEAKSGNQNEKINQCGGFFRSHGLETLKVWDIF